MKEPKLVMGEYKGRPTLELKVERSGVSFWRGAGIAFILGATAYITHGGIANNNYCGWQKNTPIKEDIKMAYKQIDEVLVEPAREAWKGLYGTFFGEEKSSGNASNSKEVVCVMDENGYAENPEKTARERAGIFLDKLQEKVRAVRDEKIISTINEAESNSRFVNELYNTAANAGEEKILELITAMGEDNVMKLVEEAASGNKEVQDKLMRCIGGEQKK